MPSYKDIYDKNKDDFDKVVEVLKVKIDKAPEEYLKEYNNDITRRPGSVCNRENKTTNKH